MRVRRNVFTDGLMSPDRSYVGTIEHRAGRSLKSRSLAFTRSMTRSAFSPKRRLTDAADGFNRARRAPRPRADVGRGDIRNVPRHARAFRGVRAERHLLNVRRRPSGSPGRAPCNSRPANSSKAPLDVVVLARHRDHTSLIDLCRRRKPVRIERVDLYCARSRRYCTLRDAIDRRERVTEIPVLDAA